MKTLAEISFISAESDLDDQDKERLREIVKAWGKKE